MHYFTSVLLLAMLFVGEALAQPLTVSVAGGHRALPEYVCQVGPHNALYPSVQVDAALFTFAEERLSTRAGVYYSYWSDGVSNENTESQCLSAYAIISSGLFSQRDHTGGIRFFVASEKGLPLMFSAGVGRQVTFIDWLRGETGWGGEYIELEDETRYATVAELGVHLRIPLWNGLHVETSALRTTFIPGGHVIGALIDDGRTAYQLGLGYTLF